MMTGYRLKIALAAFALMLTSVTYADSIYLIDGSKLVGTIERIADGKIVIVTQFAGRLEIDATKIARFDSDQTLHVELQSGDTLVGTVTSNNSNETIVNSKLGNIPIRSTDIALLWPKGEESPKVLALREDAKKKLEAARPKWTKVLEGGMSFTEGNTDTLEGHGRLDMKRKSSDEFLHLYLAGRYGEQNNARTTNEILGGIRYENNLSERRFWYTRLELEFDEFEDIDLRALAAFGGGYYWIKDADTDLQTSVGLGYRHEAYDGGRTENDAVIDLGLNYRQDIPTLGQFKQTITYSPDFQETDNYRFFLDTSLTLPLKNEQWNWKIGMRHSYNSRPQPGFDNLDSAYYTSIVLTLK